MLEAKEIGDRLKNLRGQTPLAEVSRATGIGESALRNYECGIRIPRDQRKVALADYFKTSVDALFYKEANCSNDYCNI